MGNKICKCCTAKFTLGDSDDICPRCDEEITALKLSSKDSYGNTILVITLVLLLFIIVGIML